MLVGEATNQPVSNTRTRRRRQERRADLRVRTIFQLAHVEREQDHGLWRVRNISNNGMMLCTSVRPALGEDLKIGFAENVSISGRVVWSDDEHCGVEFDRAIPCEEILNELAEARKATSYRAPRLPVKRCAVAYSECGIRSVRIANLSQHGLGFDHDGHFNAGGTIKLLMQSGRERRGVVRWADKQHAGLLLTEPFTFSELESMSRV